MNKTIFLSLLAAALALASGCAVLEGQDLGDDPIDDDGIAAVANSRLNDDAWIARATLSVTVQQGIAVLYGTVPDEATRQRALRILEASPGVAEVLDRTRTR